MFLKKMLTLSLFLFMASVHAKTIIYPHVPYECKNNSNVTVIGIQEISTEFVKDMVKIKLNWGKASCRDFLSKNVKSPKKLMLAEFYDQDYKEVINSKIQSKSIHNRLGRLVQTEIIFPKSVLESNTIFRLNLGTVLIGQATFSLVIDKTGEFRFF